MKNKNWLYPLIAMGFVLVLACGCETDNNNNNNNTGQVPVLITTTVSNITQTTASCGGNITSDGGTTVTARGVCWSTGITPTIADSKTIDGTGAGIFTSSITGLIDGTTYYIRAYATNSKGTGYGSALSFTCPSAISIGQSYQGGIIFYVDGTGQHGLICANTDQGRVEWGCVGTIIGGTSSAIGTGQANTTAIVNGCSTVGIAARLCNDLVLNGYDDWFLPSKDELNLMYVNLKVLGLGGFASSGYWSSSEKDADYAVGQNFIDGYHYPPGYLKGNTVYVRAVRAF